MRMKYHPEILAIHSDKKELIQVEQFLRNVFQRGNLPEKAFNKVLLCVSEAVINSIEHGNKNETEKKVIIEVSCVDHDIQIAVSDEGEGFNYNDVEDPTLIENIRKEKGRGIFIMKSLCNSLDFRNSGKSVEIKIELS
jgi:serine/threonine-protein kinase RsbW